MVLVPGDTLKSIPDGGKDTGDYIDFRLNDKLLHVAGLSMLLEGDGNRRKVALYHGYAYLVTAYLCATLVLEAVAMFRFWGDLHNSTINACVMLVVFMGVVKALGFALLRGRIAELQTRLRRGFPTLAGDADAAILGAAARHARGITIVFSGLSACLVSMWNTMPLLQHAYLQRRAGLNDSEPRPDRPFPMIAWYPFDTQRPYVYPAVYVTQVISAWYYGFIHIGADTYYLCFIIYISAHLKILCRCLNNLRADAVRRLEATAGVSEASLERELHRGLVLCVRRHQEIIRFVKDLGEVMSPVLLVQFFDSAIIVCLSGFQATVTVSDDRSMFLKFMVYMTTAAFQLMLYCWYGQELISQSEAVHAAAYSCGWTGAPLGFCKSIRIVMIRAQRPLQITASKFYVMSLDTFVRLLNASYSFFAVLRQLNDS